MKNWTIEELDEMIYGKKGQAYVKIHENPVKIVSPSYDKMRNEIEAAKVAPRAPAPIKANPITTEPAKVAPFASSLRRVGRSPSEAQKQQIAAKPYEDFDNSFTKFIGNQVQAILPYNTDENLHPEIRQNLEDYKSGKAALAGQITGTMAQFAVPYAGAGKAVIGGIGKVAPRALPAATGAIEKGITKILPRFGEKFGEKIGRGITESIAKDIAIGLPLNINYAYNKEGLSGEEALKSIAFNTALDIGVGGILELAPVILKSGKKVASQADFDALSAAEKSETISKVKPEQAPRAPGFIEPNISPDGVAPTFKETIGTNIGQGITKAAPAFGETIGAKPLQAHSGGVVPTAETSGTWSSREIPDDDSVAIGKERGFSKNIASDKAAPKELRKSFKDDPEFYTVKTNKETLSQAQEYLKSNGTQKSYDHVMSAIRDNSLKPEHVPLAKLVASDLVETGNKDAARNILSELSVKLTESGQLSQAARILRNSDPVSVQMYIEKFLKKYNDSGKKKLGKKWNNLNLTDNEIKMLNDINIGDESAITDAIGKIGKRLAKEIPSTLFEQFNELRRISMLLNPKTQIRNIAGNIPLAGERKIANKVSAIGQMALPKEKRTQALRISKNSKDIAKQLYEQSAEELMGVNKWDQGDLRQVLNSEREVFKGFARPLNLVAKFTYDLLQKGDAPFLKSAFVDRAASHIAAQGYKTIDDVPQHVIDLAKEEALKATFKDASKLADMINGLKRQGGVLGVATEATLPFVTTPINLVRRSIDYSPAGVIRSLANIKNTEDIPKVIDELAQGLTGTGVMIVGGYLAMNGILTGNPDPNAKKAEYEKSIGKQPFSIKTPFGTLTYEWAQPFGTQLAVGTEVYKAVKKSQEEGKEFTVSDLANMLKQSGMAAGDVILSSSVYQNVIDLFKGYGSPSEKIIGNMMDYPAQALPSVVGQIARTADPYVRTSYDKTDSATTYFNRIRARLPMASQELPIKYDSWGRPMERQSNILLRAGQEFLNPSNIAAIKETPLDKEIIKLYEQTKSNDVFPKKAPYEFSINGKNYPLNGSQVSEFQRIMGETSRKGAQKLIKSSEYKRMSSDEKRKALLDIYGDAYDYAKAKHIQKNGGSMVDVLSDKQRESFKTVRRTGITDEKYYNTYKAQSGVAGDKDEKGNTVYLSESRNKKLAIDKANPHATMAQRRALYKAFGVSESVW